MLRLGSSILGICFGIAWAQTSADTAPASSDAVQANPDPWPREIDVPEAKIVVYQPQIEEFQGDKLTARAAVAVTPTGKDEPIFGAAWFSARIQTDRDTRMCTLVSLDVTDVRFTDVAQEKLDKLAAVLKSELSKRAQPVSLDRLLTALEAADKKEAMIAKLGTDPPKILFRSAPAVLVLIDGKPELRPLEGSTLKRVVNTPFLFIQDPGSNLYYLRGGDDWFSSKSLTDGWQKNADPPASIKSLVVDEPSTQPASAPSGDEAPPEIIVSTEPAELIVCVGNPDYAPIKDTNLLYVTNTDNDVFMDSQSQEHYVVLAGRWYQSKKLEGPWSYVAADKLPPDFGKISEDSEKGDVLAHVAGTPQAEEAIHDTYIPQTAAIDRKTASVDVQYDGEPRFDPIEGTQMQYAVNTPNDVIQVGSQYFCCSEGVWFVSNSPMGPWTVCDAVPDEIYTIPPESPVYATTYVEVYESTPEVVYVGYTPGYLGYYPYWGALVYGTGYYYRGWCGNAYWARPHTWGFGVRYNSVTGNWGFRVGAAGPNGWVGFGYRNGAFYQGGWVAGGWYGGGAWGGWWGRGGYHDCDFDRNVNLNDRTRIGDRNNIYDRASSRDRLSDRAGRFDGRAPTQLPANQGGLRERADAAGLARPSSGLRNDVFADRDGSVFRRTDQGWEQRVGNSWNKADIANRGPVQRPGTNSPISRIPSSADRAPGFGFQRPSSPGQARPGVQPSISGVPRPSVSPRPSAPNIQRPSAPNIQRPSALPSQRPTVSQGNLNRSYQTRQRGEVRTNNYQSYRSSGSSIRSSGGGYQRSGGGGMRSGGGMRGGGGGRGGRR